MFSLKNSSDSYLKFVTASLFKNDENVYEIFVELLKRFFIIKIKINIAKMTNDC